MPLEPLERLIGQRLLAARNRVRWTLAEAAESVGVSVAHLSRLERGERQPSVGVLMQLARTYGVPLGQLVGEEPEEPTLCQVYRGATAPLHEGPDGRYAALSGIAGPNLLEAIRLELPEGARTSRAARHPGEEWLVVSSGRISLEIGPRPVALAPGDAAHFDAQSPHRLHSLGPGTAVVYLVSASGPAHRASGHR